MDTAPPNRSDSSASDGAAPETLIRVETGPLPETRPSWPRLAGLVALLATLFAIGHVTGLTEHLSRDNLRALMEHLGVWGLGLFLVLFAVGELVHVPGIVFVLAALLAYGRVGGAVAGYLGALASVTFSFVFVRRVGGQALAHVKRAWLAKILERLERHPIPTIAALRMVLFLLPAVNYGLAMTRVRLRDYVAGSAIGLVPPILVIAVAFEWALSFFG
jgi:uncharacterized membrane protein YdjX (TVP38/TMEM64 family)